MPNLYKTTMGRSLGYPDIGQTFYLVDTDYRTAAQGWSQSDRTGPLDLWSEKNPNQVFYAAGASSGTGTGNQYSTDRLAAQAGIDAMVDFRGDTLFWTPGNYSIAVALAINVPDARWLGPVVGSPDQTRTTITATVAAALASTNAADRMEVGYLRFVPLTAATMWSWADGAQAPYFHDYLYDTNGVAASTSTIFMEMLGAANGAVFDNFTFYTDDSQGAKFVFSGATALLKARFTNFYHYHVGANALAIALVDDNDAAAAGIIVGPGFGLTGGAGAVTTLYDLVNKTLAESNITIRDFKGSVQYATTTTIVTSAGAVNDIDLVNSWIATVEGGAGRAAYVGAA